MLELVLGIGMGLVGMTLAARAGAANGSGDISAAAFALANHVAAGLFIFFRIIGAGAGVVIAQHIGAGRMPAASAASVTALIASGTLGLLLGVIALIFAKPLLGLMNAPVEVAPIAASFLQMMALSITLDALLSTQAAALRAYLKNRHALLLVVVMHSVNLLLAIPLTLGWAELGIPALGLAGFAIAATVSRLLGVMFAQQLWRRIAHIDFVVAPRASFREHLQSILHIGLPGAAENIAYRLCFMVSVIVAGGLGAQALAAQSFALQVIYVVLLLSLAIGLSTEIVVGHLIGAGQVKAAYRLALRALKLGLLASVVVALIAALLSPILFRWFTQDASVIAQIVVLMWLTVILEPGRAFNIIVINALRAAGDARFSVAIGIGSMVIVLGFGSWLLAVPFGLGLVGVWIAYAADEWLRGVIMWHRWATLGWLPHARAMRHRLQRQSRQTRNSRDAL
jgi:putative MATE family efflux protein